jgi:hypothetical protein
MSDRKPVQATLPADVHRAFKVKLILEGKSQQDFISEAIAKYLGDLTPEADQSIKSAP